MSEKDFTNMMDDIGDEWLGKDYDITQRNSAHFCDFISETIGGDRIPRFCHQMTETAFQTSIVPHLGPSMTECQRKQRDLISETQSLPPPKPSQKDALLRRLEDKSKKERFRRSAV
eukprot:TRINITY_DN23651_c0_g1_i1.p1 TRINITY_DN23651_c0_g1~~TRINITY_DN23651_c0_g1_i1.p1  ORF type:complete len:124 (+),score=23.16 TRINITY_DN23651_c0_g1_i1:26-373(+)